MIKFQFLMQVSVTLLFKGLKNIFMCMSFWLAFLLIDEGSRSVPTWRVLHMLVPPPLCIVWWFRTPHLRMSHTGELAEWLFPLGNWGKLSGIIVLLTPPPAPVLDGVASVLPSFGGRAVIWSHRGDHRDKQPSQIVTGICQLWLSLSFQSQKD